MNREHKIFSVADILGNTILGFEPRETEGFWEKYLEDLSHFKYLGHILLYCAGNGQYYLLGSRDLVSSVMGFVSSDSFKKLSKSVRDSVLAAEFSACVISGDADECYDYFTNSHFSGIDESGVNLSDIIYGGAWLAEQRSKFLESNLGLQDLDSTLSQCVAWYANREDMSSKEFMIEMQTRDEKIDLVQYFKSVFGWAGQVFGQENLEQLQPAEWGEWYNDYGSSLSDADYSGKVKALLEDVSVVNKSGIVEYLLTDETDGLKLRKFTKGDCAKQYEAQGHVCKHCGEEITEKEARISCVRPWPAGPVSLDNAEVLCKKCDKAKKDRYVSVFG